MSTLKKGDIESKHFFDTNDNMMYERGWDWQKKEGERNVGLGDALWRTSLAYITWGDFDMKKGIVSCFRKIHTAWDDYYYQASRCVNRYGEEDVSRDQITMALVALKLNGDKLAVSDISNHLSWRLSKKFRKTIDWYFWSKSLSGSKFNANMFLVLQLLMLPIIVGWNKLLDKVLGYKSIPNNEYKSSYAYKKYEKFNGLQRLLSKSYFMGYAQHLLAWQIYTLPVNNWLRKLVSRMLLSLVEKDNYLLRLLLGDTKISEDEIESYVPKENFRWEMRLDGSTIRQFNEMDEEWKEKMLKYNQLDKDCLKKIFSLSNK